MMKIFTPIHTAQQSFEIEALKRTRHFLSSKKTTFAVAIIATFFMVMFINAQSKISTETSFDSVSIIRVVKTTHKRHFSKTVRLLRRTVAMLLQMMSSTQTQLMTNIDHLTKLYSVVFQGRYKLVALLNKSKANLCQMVMSKTFGRTLGIKMKLA